MQYIALVQFRANSTTHLTQTLVFFRDVVARTVQYARGRGWWAGNRKLDLVEPGMVYYLYTAALPRCCLLLCEQPYCTVRLRRSGPGSATSDNVYKIFRHSLHLPPELLTSWPNVHRSTPGWACHLHAQRCRERCSRGLNHSESPPVTACS